MQRIARDTRPRSPGRDPAQPGASVPLSHRHRRAAGFRRLSRRRWRRRWSRAAIAELLRRRDAARAEGRKLRHRLCRGGRAERLQHGLHHHRADAGGTAARRAEERRAGDRHGEHSIRWARVTVHVASVAAGAGPSDRAGTGRGRRVRTAARATCAWSPSWIPPRTPGRSPRATIPAASPPRLPAPRIWPRRGCATSWRASPPRSSTSRLRTWCSPAGGCTRATIPTIFGRSRVLAATEPLGAGHAAGRDGAGDARDRVLVAARTRPRRTTPTRSTPRSATASSSTSARWRSTASPPTCASTITSRCTIAAASCIPAWSPARSPAASPTRSVPRSTRNTPTPPTAAF